MLTIFKRELTSYFTQPTAYAIVIVFGFLSSLLAFTLGQFWNVADASLNGSFFVYHPSSSDDTCPCRQHASVGR